MLDPLFSDIDFKNEWLGLAGQGVLNLPEIRVHDGHMCTVLIISCTGTKVA